MSFDSAFYRNLNEDIALEQSQIELYNEGVKEVLIAILGLGSIGFLHSIDNINRELRNRPESPDQKIQAIVQADQKLKDPAFHKVATKLIDNLSKEAETKELQASQSTKPKPLTKAAAQKAIPEPDVEPVKKPTFTIGKALKDIYSVFTPKDEALISLASKFILPSEILGSDINNKANDKFMSPYQDDVKKWTIGVGHLIGDGSDEAKEAFVKKRKSKGLSPTLSRKEALELFNKDVSKRVPRVKEMFSDQWSSMSNELKAALVDIEYRGDLQKKGEGVFDWVQLIKDGKYKEASKKYLDHKEYKKRNKSKKKDGVVKRMNRNSKIIAAEVPVKPAKAKTVRSTSRR